MVSLMAGSAYHSFYFYTSVNIDFILNTNLILFINIYAYIRSNVLLMF